jgi:hypothetical protein
VAAKEIEKLINKHIPLCDSYAIARQEEELQKYLYEDIPRYANRVIKSCGLSAKETEEEYTATRISARIASEIIHEKIKQEALWDDVTFLGGETCLFPDHALGFREPATENILRDIGGINMNGRGFVTPDNIDKVIIRTKDGREFEGEVTRSEYMPGSLGRAGFSELTVCTLKQTAVRRYGIKEVIFNNPATIVKWDDGTQTVVYCQDNYTEVVKTVSGKKVKVRKPKKSMSFNPEIGLAMAIVKKHFGNMGNYNNVFRKYIPELQDEKPIEKQTEE